MKYFIQNPQIEAIIKEIRKKIRLSMNGVVADKMRESGIRYKQNFGVDIPRLKQIATEYPQNHDLAQRLWALQIRETMILATLLQPVDKFSTEMADEWLSSLHQPEIVEQTCMNLLARLPFAVALSLRWVNSDRLWHQITAFILGARVWRDFNDVEREIMIRRAVELSDTSEFHLYKSIALVLCRLSRVGKEVAEQIQQRISFMERTDSPPYSFIYSEVSREISFLNF